LVVSPARRHLADMAHAPAETSVSASSSPQAREETERTSMTRKPKRSSKPKPKPTPRRQRRKPEQHDDVEYFETGSKKGRGMARESLDLIEVMHTASQNCTTDHWTRHRLQAVQWFAADRKLEPRGPGFEAR
jgi:hypothetical protein